MGQQSRTVSKWRITNLLLAGDYHVWGVTEARSLGSLSVVGLRNCARKGNVYVTPFLVSPC